MFWHSFNDPQTYKEWLRDISNFEGGRLGWIAIVATVAATVLGSFLAAPILGEELVRELPKGIIAAPGLALGGAVFFITTKIFWGMILRSRSEAEEES